MQPGADQIIEVEASANQDSARPADKYTELVGRCRAQIHRTLGKDLPELAFVLGSGFQNVISGFRILREVKYCELPGFPPTTVAGHSGTLLLTEVQGLPCLVCSGRAHFYEGYSMEAVMFPVRMLANCGVKELVLTNAAGGINPRYRPGDFMLFSDHINFTGVNPLRGQNIEEGVRFVDLTRAYAPDLRREFLSASRRASVKLHSGVYIGVSGPSYETPAEIRAFSKLGADAVGMSTIPEALMARSVGMNVAAISCITNPAAGMRRKELSHQEVLEAGQRSTEEALKLFTAFASARVSGMRTGDKGQVPRKNLKNKRRPLGSNTEKR
jgi:purine-nucleoside phosphorylase